MEVWLDYGNNKLAAKLQGLDEYKPENRRGLDSNCLYMASSLLNNRNLKLDLMLGI